MNDASLKAMHAIRNLSLEDLDATTDADLRAEISADGGDPDALAHLVSEQLDSVVASTMREQTMAAKSSVKVTPTGARLRPAIERMKQLIEQAFRNDSKLATAFREGAHQTDADLQSLYDDLVELGKIDPERNGN